MAKTTPTNSSKVQSGRLPDVRARARLTNQRSPSREFFAYFDVKGALGILPSPATEPGKEWFPNLSDYRRVSFMYRKIDGFRAARPGAPNGGMLAAKCFKADARQGNSLKFPRFRKGLFSMVSAWSLLTVKDDR